MLGLPFPFRTKWSALGCARSLPHALKRSTTTPPQLKIRNLFCGNTPSTFYANQRTSQPERPCRAMARLRRSSSPSLTASPHTSSARHPRIWVMATSLSCSRRRRRSPHPQHRLQAARTSSTRCSRSPSGARRFPFSSSRRSGPSTTTSGCTCSRPRSAVKSVGEVSLIRAHIASLTPRKL